MRYVQKVKLSSINNYRSLETLPLVLVTRHVRKENKKSTMNRLIGRLRQASYIKMRRR